MKRSNKPYRQLCNFPIVGSETTEQPSTTRLALTPPVHGEETYGSCDHPGAAHGPQHVPDADHNTLINSEVPSTSSQRSTGSQNSTMEQSLQLVASFFGCEDPPMPETNTKHVEVEKGPEILQHGTSTKIENGEIPVLVSPDQLISDETVSKTQNDPLSANENPFRPNSSTEAPGCVPFYRNDSAPAAFSEIDSSSGAPTNGNDGISPPADFVDPDDGHIWRAKYCILEDGVLYFYRSANDGESFEAQAEREQKPSAFQENGASPLEDISDLSKSPMPRAKLLSMLDGDYRRGSSSFGGENVTAVWEKRVELDRVGAVRSAELEYGDFAFELLAVNSEDQPSQDVDDILSGDQDRLILRARNFEEMNEWLFQFHRSLVSFMKHIVEAVESSAGFSPRTGHGVPAGDIHHQSFASSSLIASIAPPFGEPASGGSGGMAFPHTPSPTGRFRPIVSHATSLSHGHGRSRLHRRRSPAHQPKDQRVNDIGSGSVPDPFPIFESSGEMLREVTPISAAKMPDSSTLAQQLSGDIVSQKPSSQRSTGSTKAKETASGKAVASVKRGKYVPPHLRNKNTSTHESSDTGRYVPPQLRKQMNHMNDAPKSGIVNGDFQFELEGVTVIDHGHSVSKPFADDSNGSKNSVSLESADGVRSSAILQLRVPLKLGGVRTPW